MSIVRDKKNIVRFVINVDQGIDIEKCGFFFYREQHESRMRVFPNVELRQNAAFPLTNALTEIRKFLETHAVEGFQIVIAIRHTHDKDERSLLLRLLQIDNCLDQYGFFNVVSIQNVVSLVVFHQEEGQQNVGGPYLLSDECAQDLHLLSETIEKSTEMTDQKEWIEGIKKLKDVNSIANYFGSRYQVIEQFVIRTDPLDRLNQLFRFVKYVTSVLDFGNTRTLRDCCDETWNEIFNEIDETIRTEYTNLLLTYRENLETYIALVEGKRVVQEVEIPNLELEKNRNVLEDEFEGEAIRKSENGKSQLLKSLTDPITRFRKHLPRNKELQNQWEKIYQDLMSAADDNRKKLDEYSDRIERKYSGVLADRREKEAVWHDTYFVVTDTLEEEISELENERSTILGELEDPQMKPLLKYQDWLNFKSALKNRNEEILQYIRCIKNQTVKLFFAVLILMVITVGSFYSALQLYDNLTSSRLLIMGGYLFGVLVLFSFSWCFPIFRYKGKIKSSLLNLENDITTYMTGYSNEIKMISHYFNRLSYLDYIDRCLNVRFRTRANADKITKWRQWHTLQAKGHRDILNDSYAVLLKDRDGETSDDLYERFPETNNSVLSDVVDCKLYWPK